MADTGHVNFDFKTTKVDPHSITVTGDCVIKFDQQGVILHEEMQKVIDETVERMTHPMQDQFNLNIDAIREALAYGRKQVYKVKDAVYAKKEDIPRIDIYKWAKETGLEISEDGKTITCYKAVTKTDDGRYFPTIYPGRGTEYKIGEYVFADKFDNDQLEECTSGLHAGNMDCAFYYADGPRNSAILELKVDISDPNNYVIPYSKDGLMSNYHKIALHKSNKFRFLKAYVVREVPAKKVYYDESTGKMWDA